MGVGKITPAHDPNDFAVGKRHDLDFVVCINSNGKMNENAFKYEGLDRFECRKKLTEDLKEENLLIKIEEINHSVGHSERTDVMVEPYLSKQWFVKMEKLAEKVLDHQKNKDTKVNFIPKRFEKVLIHWMENCHDWCISRQLWWGHRIPAWYKGEETYVGINPPKEGDWIQDEDVLDTWFSSALWPFSTLGWPNNTEDMQRYFPNSILVTGYDIIFFWVARMIFQSLEFTGKRPFKECLIHGLVRDSRGRKMSKSLGNGVDPMEIIEKYGADSLRYFLTTSSALGMDLRFDEEKVKSAWNFANKLWNASRFTLMNIEKLQEYDFSTLENHDKWILTKSQKTIKNMEKYMGKYEFNNAGAILYNFIWSDFCDSYIEMSKSTINNIGTKSTLAYVLNAIIKMLHPFMPYITDEIYNMLPIRDDKNIMISAYPKYDKNLEFPKEKEIIDNTIDFIKQFRIAIAENNISKTSLIRINNDKDYQLISFILKLENRITLKEELLLKHNVENSFYSVTIFYENQKVEIDLKLKEKRISLLESSIERRKQLLSNENYLLKAPRHLIEKEKVTLLEEEKEVLSLKDN